MVSDKGCAVASDQPGSGCSVLLAVELGEAGSRRGDDAKVRHRAWVGKVELETEARIRSASGQASRQRLQPLPAGVAHQRGGEQAAQVFQQGAQRTVRNIHKALTHPRIDIAAAPCALAPIQRTTVRKAPKLLSAQSAKRMHFGTMGAAKQFPVGRLAHRSELLKLAQAAVQPHQPTLRSRHRARPYCTENKMHLFC